MGLRDPLVVRREESEARAKAAPPHKVVTGRPRAPVGELVYFDKELILLFFSPLILLLSPVGFLFEGFEGLAITELYYPYTPRFQHHYHLLIVLHAFLARLRACVHPS